MDKKLHLSQIIGHRGACAYAPENTLASMRKAKALGAQWVEFDVMLTQDDQAIIMHDETLGRTTNAGNRKVAKTPYSDIAKLDAGSWFNEAYAHEPVPTLVELLTLLKELKLNINLEIKPTPGKEKETAEKALEILAAHWPVNESPPMISSQSPECLEAVHRLAPQYCLGIVIHHWLEPWHESIERYNCQSVSVNHNILSAEKIQALKEKVTYVLAYTVNDPEIAKKMLSWGVDAIFTDKPDLLG